MLKNLTKVEMDEELKSDWPKTMAPQAQAITTALLRAERPISAEQLARMFKRANRQRVESLLKPLVGLGQAHITTAGLYLP